MIGTLFNNILGNDIVKNLMSVLIKAVFQLILRLFDLVFYPIVSVFVSIFPDLSGVVNQFFSFLDTYLIPYIKFGLSFMYNLLGLPPFLVALIMSYFLFLYTGKYLSVAINFALNVYNKLKP